jgi:peptidoglycan hydrolase-like protein with peptidoglycan-binding domain
MPAASQPIDPAPSAAHAPPVPPARSAITDLIRGNGEASPAPSRPQANPLTPVAKPPVMRDPIAEMIRMGGAVPTPPANVGRTDNADPVLAVQRALAKLGYPVKPDGVRGGETRAAIEKFEQDRRLPVTGEFNVRTLRDLSAASGIAIPQ